MLIAFLSKNLSHFTHFLLLHRHRCEGPNEKRCQNLITLRPWLWLCAQCAVHQESGSKERNGSLVSYGDVLRRFTQRSIKCKRISNQTLFFENKQKLFCVCEFFFFFYLYKHIHWMFRTFPNDVKAQKIHGKNFIALRNIKTNKS